MLTASFGPEWFRARSHKTFLFSSTITGSFLSIKLKMNNFDLSRQMSSIPPPNIPENPPSVTYVLSDLLDAVRQSLAGVPAIAGRQVTVRLDPNTNQPSFELCAAALSDALNDIIDPEGNARKKRAREDLYANAGGYGSASGGFEGQGPSWDRMPQDQYGYGRQQNNYPSSMGRGAYPGGGPRDAPRPYAGDRSGYIPPVDPVVLFVKGAKEMSYDRLFNLICVYGNIIRMKRLKKDPDAVFVEVENRMMADGISVSLEGCEVLGGETLSFSIARISSIRPQEYANVEADYHVQEYYNTPLNRYRGKKNFRNNYKPSNMIFFNNGHPEMKTPEAVGLLFDSHGAPRPLNVTFIKQRAGPKGPVLTTCGALEFVDTKTAVEALMKVNNSVMERFTIRMSFTTSQADIITNALNEGAVGQPIPPTSSVFEPATDIVAPDVPADE